jgi:hypothetical protein
MTAVGQVTLAPDLTFKLCGSRGHPSKLRVFAPSREITEQCFYSHGCEPLRGRNKKG